MVKYKVGDVVKLKWPAPGDNPMQVVTSVDKGLVSTTSDKFQVHSPQYIQSKIVTHYNTKLGKILYK